MERHKRLRNTVPNGKRVKARGSSRLSRWQRTLLTFSWHEQTTLSMQGLQAFGGERGTSRSYILLAPAFVPLRYPIRVRPWLRSWIAAGSTENSYLPVSDRTECTRVCSSYPSCDLFAAGPLSYSSSAISLSPIIFAFSFASGLLTSEPLFHPRSYCSLFYSHQRGTLAYAVRSD